MNRALLVLLLLAGCADAGGGPQSVTERDTVEACRQQANTAFNLQNRDEIYRDYEPYSPQSSIGLSQNPTRALSDSFSQQRMIQNCIRNTGTGAERTSGPSPATGPTAVPPGPSLAR